MPRQTRLIGIVVASIAQVVWLSIPARTQSQGGDQSVSSLPKDQVPYARPADAGDRRNSRVHPKVFLRDTVVSNSDATLTNTDTFNDGELSIAINPDNHDEIAITSFAGSWATTAAPIWHSIDGGATWTKRATLARPPGESPSGCPCDQTIDFGRNNLLFGTFLTVGPTTVYTGASFDLTSAAAFTWHTLAGVTQRTNQGTVGNADQPWLLVNRDPANHDQDNAYVAYDDFNTAPDMRVAVSYGSLPPVFTTDNRVGFSTGSVNPGHRLAKDPKSGAVYSLFQRRIAAGGGGSQNINYMLNRSTDGGQTWTLNGSTTGIVVANADSTQPWPKFGTVNALLGGALHAATDPVRGHLYYVYGSRDSATGNDRLAIRRLSTNDDGTMSIGAASFVTGQVEAAIPSVAVTPNGTVGVFYYTFDGIGTSSLPIFTAHIAISKDSAATFVDTALLTFQSSAPGTGNLFDRQRVFGDYMQLKVAGGTFFGAFTGNGVAFGRPFANHDPIFFKVQATGPRP